MKATINIQERKATGGYFASFSLEGTDTYNFIIEYDKRGYIAAGKCLSKAMKYLQMDGLCGPHNPSQGISIAVRYLND